MSWESALDRLIMRQVHLAEKKEMRPAEVKRIVTDLLEVSPERPRSAFHLGYSQALLGLDFPPAIQELVGDDSMRRWHLYGQLKAHDRKGEREWVSALVEKKDTLFDLLREPGIAWGLTPILMRTFFWEEDLESALSALEFLSITAAQDGTGQETVELVRAALTDILTLVERRDEEPENGLSNREILRRCRAIEGYTGLPEDVRVRFQIAAGRSYLDSCEWEEASRLFGTASETAGEGSRLLSAALTCQAWAGLQVRSGMELGTEPDRENREELLTLLDRACADQDKAVPESFYTRGLLTYEAMDYQGARNDFDQALVLMRRSPSQDQEIIARMRFFLAAAILAGGQRDDARKAAHLLDQALDKVEPDLNTFYTVHESLKAIDSRVALKFLDAVDVGRGTSPDNLLMIGLEYINLGEADRAIESAERVLKISTDMDQRIEALKVRLTAANMLGTAEEARGAYESMRDLLLRRGRFTDLEEVLTDEAMVGQALDHIEAKCELIDILEEMEGREADRAQLQLAVARSLKARKDEESLTGALAILQEVEITYPDLARDELETVGKLLARINGDDEATAPGGEKACLQALGEKLGRPPFFLVVGGNERQRKHHPKLDELQVEWGFKSEWLMANYTSPQRLVSQIEDRLSSGSLDGLLLLHWNRHETTEPALAIARQHDCPARTVYYAGFTSLQAAMAQMIANLAPEPETVGSGTKKGGAKGGKRKSRS